MSIQPLTTAFTEGNYRYTQIERQGDIAIYRQQHKDNPKVVRYEVMRIRIAPEHLWPDGRVTPKREAYPGASQWGNVAFTCYSLDESMAVFHRLGLTKEGA